MEPEPDHAPAQIGGFRVIRRLSSGATTDVLLARAEGPHGFERVVALKVLLQQYQSDPAFERMFAREASAYARLSHPAIVKLYDFFSTDGQLVMVLEYVDGLPLHKLRAMLSIGGERFEDSAALFIGSRIFAALGAAHSARDPENGEFSPVIHRDINPSNVLVPWDGHVKISDFGIAKIGSAQGDTRLGFVKGTYGYMAPEQVRGESVTVRADVYAATLVLWELLARRKAIQRGALPEVEVLKAMAKPEIPSLDVLRPDIPPEVREAVRRGLEPSPDRRSITADEMAGVLRLAMNGDEGRARLADAIARVRPPPSEGGLAVTKAHPAALSVAGEREKARADLEATLRADPDETTRMALDAIPDDSGAFKRSEISISASALIDLADAPKSSSDLTMIDARRPAATSDPPPTQPPTSEPGTLSPDTLSLPHSPSASDWREPAQGFVRTSPAPEQPHTLRFGPGEPPSTTEDPPAPPPAEGSGPPPLPVNEASAPRTAGASPGTGGAAIAKITLTSAATSGVPRPAPSEGSPVAPVAPTAPVAPPSPDSPGAEGAPPVLEAAATADPDAPPKPLAEPPRLASEPPLPRFPMPTGDAPPPPPRAATDAPRSISPPTVRVRRKPVGAGVVLAVVLGSALLGVGGVEVYLRLAAPPETVSTLKSPPAEPPSAASPATPATAATTAAPAPPSASGPAVAAPPPVEPAAASAAPPPGPSAAASVSAAPQGAASATAPAVPPVASASASASPASSAPPPEPTARPAGSDPEATAAKMGEILTRPAAGGHRIYVDDRVVGNSPDPVQVRCGPHTVRIGSAGTPRDVEIPCGGSIVVNP